MARRAAIPAKLTLNGKRWTVTQVPGLDARGYCRRDQLVIEIDADLPEDEKESVLAHEVLHAVWPRSICSDDEEERIINALEDPVHAAFRVRR